MQLDRHALSFLAALGLVKTAIVVLAFAVMLAGCAKDPLAGAEITPPPKYLMAPPKAFPKLKEGDDAVVKLAEAAEIHNREARRIRGLQGYIKKVRGE